MVSPPDDALYQPLGGDPSLDFANSMDRSTDKPWVDRVRDYADLCAFVEAASALPAARLQRLVRSARARPAQADAVLARARALREATFRVFASIARGKPAQRSDLDLINAELALALTRARVGPARGGFAWSWDPDPDALDAPLWPLARSAAELLVSPRLELLRECASDTCLWLFLDATKNHRRRWCEMRVCGNRAKVREHRARAQRRARRAPRDRK